MKVERVLQHGRRSVVHADAFNATVCPENRVVEVRIRVRDCEVDTGRGCHERGHREHLCFLVECKPWACKEGTHRRVQVLDEHVGLAGRDPDLVEARACNCALRRDAALDQVQASWAITGQAPAKTEGIEVGSEGHLHRV